MPILLTAFCEKPLFMSQLRDLLSNPVPKETEAARKEVDPNEKTILLVEDNELNQEIAQTILEDAGFKVETANAFEEDREKSYEAGMNGHLAKPVSVETLMNTIYKFVK